MRLIDADELLTAFPIDDEPMVTKSSVRMTIRHMPTVKDAEVRPIDYQYCLNAMLHMFWNNVVTGEEYFRIMDKLNAYWEKKDG